MTGKLGVTIAYLLPVCLGIREPGAISVRQDAVTLTFRLPDRTSLGEPLILLARIDNNTRTPIVADFGLDAQTQFELRYRKPDGSTRVIQPRAAREGIAFITAPTIKPSDSYTAAVVLDDWLDFDLVGDYQLDVLFLGRVELLLGRDESDKGQTVSVERSARFAIHVGPRDVDALRARCAEWVTRYDSPPFNAESFAAGRALARVVDPVAIPYLEMALQRSQASLFFSTLVKIGGPQVIAALERMAASSNKDLSAQARSVLKTLRKQVPASASPCAKMSGR